MKYGLIYYHDTHNIGDDILSYAAKQFLPRVDYYIDRESLDVFMPDTREYVATIVNGWYLHQNYTFQPSPYLLPLFVGTHFSKDQMINNDWSYLDNSAINYLKKYEPIGCRDKNTVRILSEKNISSYFSGCLTLTIPKFADVIPNHKTVLVDVPNEVSMYIRKLLPQNEFVEKTHRLSSEEAGCNWDVREERLTEVLKLYQGANLVITTRLHCALPCLALGTPVVFCASYNEDFDIRIESFAEYLHIYSTEEIVSHKADAVILNYSEKKPIDVLVEQLSQKCKDFILYTGSNTDESALPELSLYRSIYVERTQYMRYAIHALFYMRCVLQEKINDEAESIEKTIALCNTVLDENERLKKQIEKLKKNDGTCK